MDNTHKSKDYMELMDEFFTQTDNINDNSTNNEIVELLEKNKSLIFEISSLTMETTLFKNAKVQYEEFKLEMFNKRDSTEQIIFAYGQLLDRIASSPTFLHMRGAIILIMPLLADSLRLNTK